MQLEPSELPAQCQRIQVMLETTEGPKRMKISLRSQTLSVIGKIAAGKQADGMALVRAP